MGFPLHLQMFIFRKIKYICESFAMWLIYDLFLFKQLTDLSGFRYVSPPMLNSFLRPLFKYTMSERLKLCKLKLAIERPV
jgi:hypothetical protein